MHIHLLSYYKKISIYRPGHALRDSGSQNF